MRGRTRCRSPDRERDGARRDAGCAQRGRAQLRDRGDPHLQVARRQGGRALAPVRHDRPAAAAERRRRRLNAETKPMARAVARELVLIGSGEMGPRMARVQRGVIARLASARGIEAAAVRVAVVDTPYAFQANAQALSDTALEYFSRRLDVTAEIAAYRRSDDPIGRERSVAAIREADVVFSGPGSPSYALRHWSSGPFAELLATKLSSGGAVMAASAAALTLGRFTAPIYEMYKAGLEPHWLQGVDVLSELDLDVAVIPHYDNAEGGTHDTRFCFIGETRLEELERQLPPETAILGVDEHTAL